MSRTPRDTVVVLLLLAAGCSNEIGRPVRDAGVLVDAGPSSLDAPIPPGTDAALDPDAGEVIRGVLREEICGNLFDDDDNGIIDDGCGCAVGTERACWLGPPDARGIGACLDGVQRCESSGAAASWTYCLDTVMPTREVIENGADDDCDGTIDEPDGICLPSENIETGATCANGRDDDCDTRVDCNDPGCVGMAGCPGGCASNEVLCWGEHDDDCDGDVDCDDGDCAADVSCATGPCPAGQTPTYSERPRSASAGASYIATGDGQPIMPVTCEMGVCPAGQVAVILSGSMRSCVPPPPDCPSGTNATYVASGTWRCDPPCELLIHYGSIYSGLTVCAGRPDVSCGSGQSPTFVFETRTWQCRTTCNNTLYDRIVLDGQTVCVPC